ncbi:Pyridoxine-5'-phosphate oxidase [Halotydeus destructor]|nr:Pyridoxine-5'-phosphate oxidase [Halotydeus destructor]
MTTRSIDLSAMRQPYLEDSDVLLEENLPSKDPFELFGHWFTKTKESGLVLEPNAVCLATADSIGRPTARMVLLKSFGSEGFKVFTNFSSKKGRDLTENPFGSLLFYWAPFNRQVRIEGTVERVPDKDAIEYFNRRPKRSQISAAVSDQSQPIESRQAMIDSYNELEVKYKDEKHIPKPETWGGYNLVPDKFEFWQGQTSRLHDRVIFEKQDSVGNVVDGKVIKPAENGWIMKRLQP